MKTDVIVICLGYKTTCVKVMLTLLIVGKH